MREKVFEVREFDVIAGVDGCAGTRYLEPPHFDELMRFVKEFSPSEEGDSDAMQFFKVGAKRGAVDTLSVRNYVGLIETPTRKQIQILPKIDFSNGDGDLSATKAIFLRMLRSLRQFSSKALGTARLDTSRMSLFEIFIAMYLREAEALVKRGLRSDYVPVEEDLPALRGRLILKEQLSRNLTHKERFAVRHDEYLLDRPENKIVKSTLLKLREATDDPSNKRDAIRLLSHFEMVSPSSNVDADLSRCSPDRSTAAYRTLIAWSRVFLKNRSFTTFSGESGAKSLLFPMHTLFESYVAREMARAYSPIGWSVRAQDQSYRLFDDPSMFRLKPDIVVKRGDGHTVILDTKWKSLNPNQRENYGISQGDVYQMYAYSKKYKTRDVFVLYPLNNEMRGHQPIDFRELDAGGNATVHVRIRFVDLEHMDASLNEIRQQIESL